MATVEKCDYVVVGSGVAGLTFALKVAEYGTVSLITKKENTESNTNYAQGGIAVVMSDEDTFEQHINDTLSVGCGLSDRKAVEIMVKDGPRCIEELVNYGVEFSFHWENKKKILSLGREGGHTRNRIVHRADHTGKEVEHILINRCQNHPNIKLHEHTCAADLAVVIENGEKRCVGVWAVSESGELSLVQSQITLLATGGCGQVYLHTTNPSIATGDGVAMAFRAGAQVGNLEFMQFHPTTLFPRATQAFLISEAVRGFGGVLRNSSGENFMVRYHPLEDLAPRDVVARAIDHELKARGEDCVYLDVTAKRADETRERFPNIYKNCLAQNIDITRDWIPVVPAAHYMCGGVVTDLWGKTTIKGLYAAGETAMTGVHGANRLASNSLLEAVVFSNRAAEACIEERKDFKPLPMPDEPDYVKEGFSEEEWILVSHDIFEIKKLMWDYVGIVRSNLRLDRALRRVELIRSEVEDLCKRSKLTSGLVELRNMSLLAWMIIQCAISRKESRGLHFNTDYSKSLENSDVMNTFMTFHKNGF